MEWVVKLEARSGWGKVETIEVATTTRRLIVGHVKSRRFSEPLPYQGSQGCEPTDRRGD